MSQAPGSGPERGHPVSQDEWERTVKASAQDRCRKFGSVRILRDGRVRFSPWTFPGLRAFCFAQRGDSIEVERGSRVVLYLWAPRGRVASACFAYDLGTDKLRSVVSDLRSAGHGLERWIIPGLEYTRISTSWENNPDTYAVINELLESCRNLPIAKQWMRVREIAFVNADRARAEQEAASAAPGKQARATPPARTPRAKANRAVRPGKRTLRKK